MKSSLVLKFFAAAILVLAVAVTANNVTYGHKGPYDRLLARFFITKPRSWWGAQTELVEYPPKGYINYNILTAIILIDRGAPQYFGHSTLLKGGPGFRNATIRLKSQSRKPLNFTIEYYTRPN